jgi:hypothetical protein
MRLAEAPEIGVDKGLFASPAFCSDGRDRGGGQQEKRRHLAVAMRASVKDDQVSRVVLVSPWHGRCQIAKLGLVLHPPARCGVRAQAQAQAAQGGNPASLSLMMEYG